jgi:tetratricopeptide (TPR) repeat protein
MPFADKYIESSPGIPHAFHMQAHLATRIGRWDKTSDRSARAIELHRLYQKAAGITPKEDYQFSHHLEVVTLSLTHDGRFQEARAIKQEAAANNIRFGDGDTIWFRLHVAERDWDEARKLVEQTRKRDKTSGAYLGALLALHQYRPEQAAPEIEVLRQAGSSRRNDRRLEERLWEVQGWYMCQTGAADEGLKLLARVVDKTKNNYGHHAWGNGAYYMEVWGQAALGAGKFEAAEEAFLEALAHDHGSAKAALGMQVLCERQARYEEAKRFAELARRNWCRAEVRNYDALYAALAKSVPPPGTTTAAKPAATTPTR